MNKTFIFCYALAGDMTFAQLTHEEDSTTYEAALDAALTALGATAIILQHRVQLT